LPRICATGWQRNMNMPAALAPFTLTKAAEIIEAVMIRGDLANLTTEERAKYYVRVCQSVGLNPMTRPFEYIVLNNKLTLYARKDATDQLRALHKVSVTELTETEREGVCIVTAKVMDAEGRTDAAKGAVTISGLTGDALANAIMKAETKAKRRATLSLCGLGLLDETELETIPASAKGTVGDTTPALTASARRALASDTITVARKSVLPKKDAAGAYRRLQAELDAETVSDDLGETMRPRTSEDLADWWEASADRVSKLHPEWQEILRLRYEETLSTLRQREKASDNRFYRIREESTKDRMLAEIPSLTADQILPWELSRYDEYETMPKEDRDMIDAALRAHNARFNGKSHLHVVS